jgi:hypothetical protein
LSYVEENNGIEAETFGWFKAVETEAEGGEIIEKRKMFSHRELPFPTTWIAFGRQNGRRRRARIENRERRRGGQSRPLSSFLLPYRELEGNRRAVIQSDLIAIG